MRKKMNEREPLFRLGDVQVAALQHSRLLGLRVEG